MLEFKFVRENLSTVQRSLGARGVAVEMAAFEQLDAKRKKVLLEIENLRHRRNVVPIPFWLICVRYPVESRNLTVLCLKLRAI